ncbi:SCP2 sterol-binding domain-containing protein [Streptomyces hirsutus]
MAVDVQKWFDEDFGAGLVRHADEARKVETKFQVSITGEGGGEWWSTRRPGRSSEETRVVPASRW